MIVVKLTIFLIILTVILCFFVHLYLSGNPYKALQISKDLIDPPWFCYLSALLFVLDAIGIIASAVWLLFLR